MKRLLSAVVIILTLGLQAASAQGENWKSNDISLGYGYYTFTQVALTSTSLISSMLPNISNVTFTVDKIAMKSTGSINFEYNRRFTKVFSLGLAAAYEKGDAHIDGTGSAFGLSASGTADVSIQTLSAMLNLRLFWFNKPHVSMYSKLAGGVSFVMNPTVSSTSPEVKNEMDKVFSTMSVLPAVQASPVCIDFGGEALRGYVELGIGTQGSVLGGLRYRF